MTGTKDASFHVMFTPKHPTRRYNDHSSIKGTVSPTEGFTALDALDVLRYHFDNTFNSELPEDTATTVTRRVQWETSSIWKLMIEVFRMEALNDRLSDEMFETTNPIRDGFMKYKEFRRLMALIRWCHWVNSEEAEVNGGTPVSNPAGGSLSKSTHQSIDESKKPMDRRIFTMLSQGRIMDAIDFCSTNGENWRAGVIHAAIGHEVLTANSSQDDRDIEPDWVECEIISDLNGVEDMNLDTRLVVKRTAKDILRNCTNGEEAFMGILCGNENAIRSATGSSISLDLWSSLHAIKESFVCGILLGSPSGDDSTFDYKNLSTDVVGSIDEAIRDAIESVILTLSDMRDLENGNHLKNFQFQAILGNWDNCIEICFNWINDGIIRIGGSSIDIDLSSSRVDGNTAILVRAFACSFSVMIRDFANRRQLHNVNCLEENISTIIVANIESLIAQFKSVGPSGLIRGNGVIVDTMSLLMNPEIKMKTWAWYLRQYLGAGGELVVDKLEFEPIISLLESYPQGAIGVVKLLVSDLLNKRIEFVLNHAVGSSIEAGQDIGFGILCLNTLWLLAQSAAKSTGSGIYLELIDSTEVDDDPEEAAARIVYEISNCIGESLGLLLLADFQPARAFVHLTQQVGLASPSGSKLVSISAATEAVQDGESESDVLGVVASFVRILERVTAVMERNSLLEQQRTNLAKLSSSRDSRVSVAGVSTEARRQIIETQRLIDSTTEMVTKMTDDIVKSVAEYVEGDVCPLDCRRSVLGIDEHAWGKIVSGLIDVLLESSVQAIALVDDKKKQEFLRSAVAGSKWVHAVLPKNRLGEILEEIA